MDELSTFARLLRHLRSERGLTQAGLAQQVSCGTDTIKKLETDARHPSRQMAARLADQFALWGSERAAFLQAASARNDRNVGQAVGVLAAADSAPSRRKHTESVLPLQTTSFIGRENEIQTLTGLLVRPDCRLVTLLGPGGIGKSRLAIEVAGRLLAHSPSALPPLPDGVWFIALQAVDSPERLASAIADAIRCPPPGAADVRRHLLSYLQSRRALLVLDNFEHLRSGADLLTAILTEAPGIRLLVTSRVALNLDQEWRYPLSGLPLSAGDDRTEAAQSSATRLFVERARRVSPAFDCAAECGAVQRICHLVEGVPLALELAAIWTRVLSCTAIADEIVSNLAFLTSDMRNTPDRQRSMQAVFDHSWSLLGREERQVCAQLSVFRGGFQRHAAEAVAGAALPVLTALVDKSLLRWEAGDRYRMHELLRQYAAERLEESGEETIAAHARHCAYYTDFLDQRSEEINGQRQRQVMAEIATDLENIRAAWQYALGHGRIAEIERAVYTLHIFYDSSSRYREGAELFEQAMQQLEKPPANRLPTMEVGPALLAVLVGLGWLSIRLGELQRARRLLERGQTILTRLGLSPRPASFTDPLAALGTLANVMGDYTEAARLGEQARRRAEAQGDLGNFMSACYVLTSAAFARGHYVEADRYARRACELAEQLHERWFMAYLVADLGNIARAVGDYAEAARQYRIGYAIREEFGDPEGIAVALVNLGRVSLLQADPETARAQFQQSLAIYGEIGDQGGVATALHGLGVAALAVGSCGLAAKHLHEVLQIVTSMEYASLRCAVLASVAELFVLMGDPSRAVGLLVSILRDPTSDHATCDQAHALLARCESLLSPEQFAAASQGRHAIDLPALFDALRIAGGDGGLPPGPGARSASQPASPPKAQRRQPLVEPLTEREFAVLHLLAEGCSNREIAARLVMTPGSAKWYVSQIFGKLGVHSRTQAIASAKQLGYLA